MTHPGYSRGHRLRIMIMLVGAWAFTAAWGFASVFLTPITVQEEVGVHLPQFTGWLAIGASVMAVYAVVTDKYYVELVAAWFAAASAFAYLVTVWGLVLTTTPTRLQQAAALSSLFFFYLYRVSENAARVAKNRTIHEQVVTGPQELPPHA